MSEASRALVTGTGKGIGLALSQRLAKAGYEVIGVARTAPEGEFPGTFLRCDLSGTDATAQLLDEVTRERAVCRVVNTPEPPNPSPSRPFRRPCHRRFHDADRVRTNQPSPW